MYHLHPKVELPILQLAAATAAGDRYGTCYSIILVLRESGLGRDECYSNVRRKEKRSYVFVIELKIDLFSWKV